MSNSKIAATARLSSNEIPGWGGIHPFRGGQNFSEIPTDGDWDFWLQAGAVLGVVNPGGGEVRVRDDAYAELFGEEGLAGVLACLPPGWRASQTRAWGPAPGNVWGLLKNLQTLLQERGRLCASCAGSGNEGYCANCGAPQGDGWYCPCSGQSNFFSGTCKGCGGTGLKGAPSTWMWKWQEGRNPWHARAEAAQAPLVEETGRQVATAYGWRLLASMRAAYSAGAWMYKFDLGRVKKKWLFFTLPVSLPAALQTAEGTRLWQEAGRWHLLCEEEVVRTLV